MTVPEIDIFRAANLWAAQHGEAAIPEARKKAAEFHTAGDRDGADVWLRIIVAVETLRAPATALH